MTDPQHEISFNQLGLGNVLKQFRLHVPPNQREYSWTDREVVRLFQDIAKAISEGDKDYFLGTIVTIKTGPDQLEVVDGQQRLATTAIFLSAIRNYLEESEPVISRSIGSDFLYDTDREKRSQVPRLTLNVTDNEFFQRRVIDGESASPTRASHELIEDALAQSSNYINKVLAAHDKKHHGDELNRWISYLQHNALVVLLRVPTAVNAFKMFETLNDRGLRTSQSDLVKNYLFGQSGDRLGEAQQKWTLMRGALESLAEDDITLTFLRQALIAMNGYLRESEIYERAQESARGPNAAVRFCSELEALSADYVAILSPDHEKWNAYTDATRRAIQTLLLLNVKPMRPLSLAIAARFGKSEAERAFRTLINWAVRLLIVGGTRTGAVEVTLASCAKDVFAGETTTTKQLREDVHKVIPTDEAFRREFEVATVSVARLARYYLRSLEREAKKESEPAFVPNDDRATINLEHILPRNPENNWPQFDAEEARVFCRRLGNMALLSAMKNSDLRSADFETKKAVFRKSPYLLTKQIADAKRWGPNEISDRQKTMAELAVSVWPLLAS